MMNNMIVDYRNTSYCKDKHCFKTRKAIFYNKFKNDHPRVTNDYSYLNDGSKKENREFKDIYFLKCAYCGVTNQVIGISRYELDHFLPQATTKKDTIIKLDVLKEIDKNKINSIENIVCSCQFCNRQKRAFLCEESENNLILLHPDNNLLPQVFYREEDYSIKVKSEYQHNKDIEQFYYALKLDNEIRRIDYLLMEMKDFCKIYEDDGLVLKIKEIISKIEQKRRFNF